MSPFEAAVSLHQAGDVNRAAIAYQNVLSGNPDNHRAAFLLAVINLQRQEWQKAATVLRSAIAAGAHQAEYHVALGIASRNMGDLAGARSCYTEALRLDPASADAHNNLGTLHEASGDVDAAQECFQSAIRFRPGSAEGHYNLGNILRRRRSFRQAADCYRQALSCNRVHREAAVNLAIVLCKIGDFDGAERALRKIESELPSDARVVSLLGVVLVANEKWNDAGAVLTEYFARRARPDHGSQPNQQALRHDCEQIRYLSESRIDVAGITETLRSVSSAKGPGDLDDGAAAGKISQALADAFYIEPCGVLDSSPLNPNMSVLGNETDLVSGACSHLVMDAVLTAAALDQIREFCLRSTIWQSSSCGSELIANMQTGFSCPLLFQIAGELKRCLPTALGNLNLVTAWAYRYVGDVPEFGPHADPGLMTVNLWITPDEANLQPGSGGLQIWGIKAPAEYIGQERAAQLDIVRDLLSGAPARELNIIPYKCNRAVVFPSLTVHSTDQFHFAPGFSDRRMNITLLFGDIS